MPSQAKVIIQFGALYSHGEVSYQSAILRLKGLICTHFQWY